MGRQPHESDFSFGINYTPFSENSYQGVDSELARYMMQMADIYNTRIRPDEMGKVDVSRFLANECEVPRAFTMVDRIFSSKIVQFQRRDREISKVNKIGLEAIIALSFAMREYSDKFDTPAAIIATLSALHDHPIATQISSPQNRKTTKPYEQQVFPTTSPPSQSVILVAVDSQPAPESRRELTTMPKADGKLTERVMAKLRGRRMHSVDEQTQSSTPSLDEEIELARDTIGEFLNEGITITQIVESAAVRDLFRLSKGQLRAFLIDLNANMIMDPQFSRVDARLGGNEIVGLVGLSILLRHAYAEEEIIETRQVLEAVRSIFTTDESSVFVLGVEGEFVNPYFLSLDKQIISKLGSGEINVGKLDLLADNLPNDNSTVGVGELVLSRSAIRDIVTVYNALTASTIDPTSFSYSQLSQAMLTIARRLQSRPSVTITQILQALRK